MRSHRSSEEWTERSKMLPHVDASGGDCSVITKGQEVCLENKVSVLLPLKVTC